MKMKRILSIILSILLIGATFILSFSASAVDNNISLTWEMNWIDSTEGTDANLSKTIRTVGYTDINDYSSITINVLKNASDGVYAYWYTKDKAFINRTDPNRKANNPSVITVPSNAKYVRFILWSEAITDNSILSKVNTASGVNNEYFNITANKLPTINTSKTGLLNIHKYEMSDVSVAKTNGTGYENDKTNVPAGAKGLNGVTFTAKRVANLSSTYYTAAGTALPTVSQAKTMTVLNTYTQTTSTVSINGTDTDGVAQFTNLPLGIYLVQETSSPSHVTKKVDDFIVSIPYTSSDGTSWKYTVDVFPKNETKYANVRIKKVDKSNTSRGLANAGFNVWQSPDNSEWTRVSSVVTDSSGIVDVTNLATNHYYRLGETGAPAGYINDNANSNNQTYFFLDTDGKVLSRDKSTTISTPSGTTPAIITITNAKPSIQKYIDASRGNGSELYMVDSIKRYNDDNNYQYYMVKVTPPNIDSSLSTLKTFKVTDSFMNINGSKMAPTIHKITCGTDAIQANRNVLSADAYTYTCTQNSTTNTTYDTTLTFDTSKFTKGMNYYIYYKCFVTIAGTNNAKLVYSTQTLPESTATSTITSNTVRFIVGSYQLLKTNNQDAPLQGAEFQLFTSREDALACKNPVYASTSSGGATQTTTFTSNSSGKVYIWDINVGNSTSSTSNDYYPSKTYWLVETKAPTGYNLLAEPVEITVTRGGANSLGVTIVNSAMYTFPLTGSAGILICIVCGVLMIGVAVVVLLVKKKRSKSKVGGN